MEHEAFETIVADVGLSPVPEKFHARLKNIAFVIEDEPDREVRELEGLGEDETLLGYYRGIPLTERGSDYGVGMTLPDVITLYRLPTIEEARASGASVRDVVEDTILHEVAHYLGMDEEEVRKWEEKKKLRS
ncbi:metallopeptidase family protein [Candidatus Parcubacteria bacterium]|nr:metallopeptidase family protein [Candidatus Parcubacteria bacterium]